MAAGASLPNRQTGQISPPCSLRLIRAWRYGHSVRSTSSEATSRTRWDRMVSLPIVRRFVVFDSSTEASLIKTELRVPSSKFGVELLNSKTRNSLLYALGIFTHLFACKIPLYPPLKKKGEFLTCISQFLTVPFHILLWKRGVRGDLCGSTGEQCNATQSQKLLSQATAAAHSIDKSERIIGTCILAPSYMAVR